MSATEREGLPTVSEFLGFAWELLAKVVYNVVAVVSSILNLLVFGWVGSLQHLYDLLHHV